MKTRAAIAFEAKRSLEIVEPEAWWSTGMTPKTVTKSRAYGGIRGVYRQQSVQTKTSMIFSGFGPDHASESLPPAAWYLSGLTCTYAKVVYGRSGGGRS